MTSVYVVTSGEYSDYRIQAVFSTREAAQVTADLMNGDEGADAYGAWQVEEWPLDEEPHRKAWACVAFVRVARQVLDGEEPNRRWVLAPLDGPEVEIGAPALNDDQSTADDRVSEWPSWVQERRGEPPYQWLVRVTATDSERARKVAAERAYQVAAEWGVHVEAARSRGELA